MELVTAHQLSEVLQISEQAVRKGLADLPREKDTNGLTAWRRDQLPERWAHKLELALKIKGCDTLEELLFCRRHAAQHFEFRIEEATDHEKKLWPKRKEAILEYYRALEGGEKKSNAEARGCRTFERISTMPVSTRNFRRWLEPVEKCGGPQHAPDEAYVLWGKRRTLEGPPRETVEYFNKLITDNQRKFAPAWKALVQQLRAWRQTGDAKYRIPGYNEPPLNAPGSDLPLRWSYAYFVNRRRRPAPIVVAGARYGTGAMRELAAIVRKTRVGVKVGEIIQFDDQVYDVPVNVLGINNKATRPLGLDAIDYASACVFASLFKPTVYDDEERARRMLKQRDMIWFAVHILTSYGYRTDASGTTWYVEHGTAAIPEWLEENIKIVTGGNVRIRRGGIGGDPAFAGVFEGAKKGNPRLKGLLEGARNRLRNDMADMLTFPGAVGKDRDHSPEENYGRDKYNDIYLRAFAALKERERADLAEQLISPYLEWRVFPFLAFSVIEAINTDIEHNCEGWAACGYTTNEFRLDQNSQWLPMRELLALEDPVKRNAALAYFEAQPSLTRTRKLSRREVWQRDVHQLTRMPVYLIPQLLTHQAAQDFSVMRRVTAQGEFVFNDEEADPYGGQFVFLARVHDRSGHEVRLTHGEKYKTFLNPLDPSTLIVCQPNGAFLGACPAVNRAAANDLAATSKLIAQHRSLLAEAKSDLARLGRERTRELARMKMHNEGLVSPEKTERAKQMEEATDKVAALYV